MFIESLGITGFGQFQGLELSGLEPGLVVVRGPNEAGKSTLRSFIRWMLFGTRRGDVKRWISPSGDLGGRLTLGLGDDTVELVRDRREVLVRTRSGVTRGEEAVREVLLQGLTDKVYAALFTFDLFDLQRLDFLQDDRLHQVLAGGTLVGAGIHPSDILEALDKEASALSRPRGKCLLRSLGEELTRTTRALEEARAASERYDALVARTQELGSLVTDLDREAARVGARRAEASACLAAWPDWERLTELRARLEALGPPGPLDRRLSDDLVRARVELEQAEAEVQRAEETRDESARSLAGLTPDEDLLSAARLIDEAAARVEAVQSAARQLQRLEASTPDVPLELLGQGWTEDDVLRIQDLDALGARAEDLVRGWVSEFEDPTRIEAELRDVEGEHQDLLGETRTLREALLSAPVTSVRGLLEEAGEALRLHDELSHVGATLQDLIVQEPPTAPGWPDVEQTTVQHLEEWERRFSEARVEARERLRQARLTVEAARANLDDARRRLAEISLLPGEGAPGHHALAKVQATWEGLAADVGLLGELRERAEALARQQDELVREVEPWVDRDTLASIDSRLKEELHRAYDEFERANAKLDMAETEVRTLGPDEDEPEPGPTEQELQRRRQGLLELRAALEEQAGLVRDERGARGGWLPWAAASALLVVALVAVLRGDWVLGGLSLASGLAVALAAWARSRHERMRVRSDLLDDIERRAEELGVEPSRGAVEAALEQTREALEAARRRQELARRVRARNRGRAEAEARMVAARRRVEEAAGRVGDLLRGMGLPDGLGPNQVWAILEAASRFASQRAELDRVEERVTSTMDRVERFVSELTGLLHGPVRGVSPWDLDWTIQGLARWQEAADARSEAIRRESARVREAEAVLARATEALEALARERARSRIPDGTVEDWEAWRSGHGLPAGEPVSTYIHQARLAAEHHAWSERVQELRSRVEELEAGLAGFMARLGSLERTVGMQGSGQLWERVRALGAWLDRVEAQHDSLAQREARELELRERIVSLTERLRSSRELEARASELAAAFDEWRRDARAPEWLRPMAATEWVQRLVRVRDSILVARDARNRAAALRSEIRGFVERVQGVAEALGESIEPDLPYALAALDGWRGELAKARELAARRDAARAALEVATATFEQTSSRLTEKRRRWERLLERIGCEDEHCWRAKEAARRDRTELREEVARVQARLQARLGPSWEGRLLSRGSRGAWEVEVQSAAAELEAITERLKQAHTELGRLQATMDDLERSEDQARLSLEVAKLQARVQTTARRWVELTLAKGLLWHSFERFRRARQPAVVARASRWFASATENGYRGLDVVRRKGAIRFVAIAASGEEHPVDGLSAGTAGLVYLCLRLSLAIERAGDPPPMLMDDVLAYFDAERAAEAWRLIDLASQGRQIFVFTAADHVPDSPATLIELPRWAGGDGPRPRHKGAGRALEPTRRNGRVTGGTRQQAEVPPSGGSPLIEAALTLMAETDHPLARKEFMEGLGIVARDWPGLREALDRHPRVQVSGAGRGTRYSLAEQG